MKTQHSCNNYHIGQLVRLRRLASSLLLHLVKALRYDEGRLIEGYLLRAAQRSDIFAHILIWRLQGEQYDPELGKDAASTENNSFQTLSSVVRQRIVDRFTLKALDLYSREFSFFDQVTYISSILPPQLLEP